jgi:plastocyanin
MIERGTRGARRARWLLTLGTALAVVPGVAACGGGGDDGAGGPSSPHPEVALVDFAFRPADPTIRAGQTVTFGNQGEQIHNVRGEGFFSDALAAGASYSHRFAEPGRYPYLCTLHPSSMRGVITVEAK